MWALERQMHCSSLQLLDRLNTHINQLARRVEAVVKETMPGLKVSCACCAATILVVMAEANYICTFSWSMHGNHCRPHAQWPR